MIIPERKYKLYKDALVRTLEKYKGKELTRDYYIKVALLGVKSQFLDEDYSKMTPMEVFLVHTIISFVKDTLETLTVGEFLNIFPIDKTYDGERWQIKDYFYTREYLKQFKSEDIIGDNIMEFLWEYNNSDIRRFNVSLMMSMDNIRKSNGESSIAEEWAEENGLSVYSKNKDNQGKEFLYDRKNQRTVKVKKNLPSYLKVVK